LKYQQNIPNNNTEREQHKWITFTYTGNYIRKITKLFKDTNLKIAFKTTSTRNNFLTNKQKTNMYVQSGIYKINCQSCYKVYIGQTGRTIKIRYKEHLKNIKNNRRISICPEYTKHGPSIRTHGANHGNGRGDQKR
jgi:hypothetical protein